MKQKRMLKILFVFAVVWYIFAGTGTVFAGTLSSDINGIDDSKYPGIKSEIQSLQKKHSNYEFQVYYTGIDWTEAVTMEYQGHGKSPKNLFNLSNSYKGKWYCPICGSKTYDTGWYCASVEAIEYMMDPRNSLDETSIFQFKNLETSDVSQDNIRSVINSKYKSYSYINNSTIIKAIVDASSQNQLNGYSILAKIINEQGKGSSPLVTGAGYNGQYVGYYNFFNVGAYGNGTSAVMLNGLSYAKNKGWNSARASILGGSEYYKSSYIGKGQNTLYYQRFNVIYTTSLFSHQYQQDIMGAQTSATLLKSYYTTSSTIDTVKQKFIIPLYENMPTTKCSRPSTTENSELKYDDAQVLVNKLAVRAAPNSSRIISYLNKGESVKVLNRASSKSSDGKYWDTIVSVTDGTYGYVSRSDISHKSDLPVYVFDSQYYADNNADLKKAFGYDEYQLLEHFTTFGIKEGRSASPAFDVKYYLNNNSDLKKAFGNDYEAAYNHFITYGCNEYRKSSALYDAFFYRYYYSDLTSMSSKSLLEHYVTYGKNEGRIAALDSATEAAVFDAEFYSAYYSDLKAAFGTNSKKLKQHWLTNGIKEGRTASLTYDPKIYLELNTDLQGYSKNYKKLFEHFVNTGISEGRRASLIFDVSRYVEVNSDIKKAFGTNYKLSYEHFKTFGIKEGRNASYVFEVKTYLNKYRDLRAAFGTDYKSAMIHFLRYGIKEKRVSSSTFSVSTYYSKYKDLQNAFGTNYQKYYIHYLLFGRNEGRKAI